MVFSKYFFSVTHYNSQGSGGGGGLTSDSKWGSQNTFFSVTHYNSQGSGGTGAEKRSHFKRFVRKAVIGDL